MDDAEITGSGGEREKWLMCSGCLEIQCGCAEIVAARAMGLAEKEL